MQNWPQHQNKFDPTTHAPDVDAPYAAADDADNYPDAAGNNADYPKSIHLSLQNRNFNQKIAPNTKNNKNNTTPNTNIPDTDSPDASDNDDDYP